VGTSTGGILALGLASGLTGGELLELYRVRGREIFPPGPSGLLGRLWRGRRAISRLLVAPYSSAALEALLQEVLGDRLLGSARTRLCIPSFDGRHSEVYLFKTPHHPDYVTDRHEKMVTVGLATAAAPTFFRPLASAGYTFVDGGVWANNPIMLGVVEALTCFDLRRDQVEVLSLGCGDDPYVVTWSQRLLGGLLSWRTIMFAAMRLQSLAATNQARLLLGPEAVVRIDAVTNEQKIQMDDWRRAITVLPIQAEHALTAVGEEIGRRFLVEPAQPYVPCS
jgi:patatin-like phospholipase/acyl hydrolase